MSNRMRQALLVAVLLIAAILRLTGIDWDAYDHHHPDERYITWVATTIEWPADWSTALKPAESSFNPYYWPPEAASHGIEVPQDEPRKFAYGHLPLYLGVAATRLAERLGPALVPLLPGEWLLTRDILNGGDAVEYRHLTAVARALTALADMATVWLVYLLGRRVYNASVGLLAAAFLALNVMHIQLAHFYAFDPYVTLFVVGAMYFMVSAVDGRPGDAIPGSFGKTGTGQGKGVNRRLFLAAAFIGLAVGSKFASILLFLPLMVALYSVGQQRKALALVAVAVLVFVLTNPFAVLDFSCEVITPAVEFGPLKIPALDWRSCFLDNISTQGGMVRGDIDLPFTRQYIGTLPYLYFIEMQVRWGMGFFLGALAFSGFGWAIWQALSRAGDWRRGLAAAVRRISPTTLVLLAWTLPYFLITGSFQVKFMRYMQPLTPFLMLYGATLISQWQRARFRRLAIVLVITTSSVYALSFAGIYRQPHPWTAASEWIYRNIPAKSLILSEQWDDSLPVSLTVDGERRRRTEYPNEQLTWLTRTGERDNVEKLQDNLQLLARARYLTLVSNRVYGVIPRLPELYPISSQYHRLLFDGSLGYEVVSVHGRFPGIAGLYLKPDTFGWPGLQPPTEVSDYLASFPGINMGRADESFTVYDQPLTIIFENVDHKTAEEMAQLFNLDKP